METTSVTQDAVIESIRDSIEIHTCLNKQEDGSYVGEIYVDYRDELCFDNIKKIACSDTPMETFYDIFAGCEDNYEYSYVFDVIKNNWDESIGEHDIWEDFVREWVFENIHFDFPYNHFLKQPVLVNIIVNTGDGNYDFTLNNFASYNSTPGETINNESSILWLIKQQGYTKTQLNWTVRQEDFSNSKFLKSVYQELTNVTTHMNALAFFVKMTLKEFIDLKENPRKIILPASTSCGLYDPWNGAGSVLEIELDKEVIVPKKYAEPHIDGTRGYGIDKIYGMCSSFWK